MRLLNIPNTEKTYSLNVFATNFELLQPGSRTV